MLDEALAGFCTDIDVDILPGDVISVRDNGRGIPVGMNEKLGLPTVTVVLTVLHAGGKFGGSGYKVSGGLHGVGSSVVNALSSWMEVEISRDGKIYAQRFERGIPVNDLTVIGNSDHDGTLIRFKADPEIFQETTEYEFEVLQKRLREQAFLNAGLMIRLNDLRNPENEIREEYRYEGGISSFVDFMNKARGHQVLHPDVIHISRLTGIPSQRSRCSITTAITKTSFPSPTISIRWTAVHMKPRSKLPSPVFSMIMPANMVCSRKTTILSRVTMCGKA